MKIENGVNLVSVSNEDVVDGVFVVPENVRVIMEGAFTNIDGLEKIVIPNEVEIISKNAFRSLKDLKEVKIPSSVERIDYQIFEDCVPEKIEYNATKTFITPDYCEEKDAKRLLIDNFIELNQLLDLKPLNSIKLNRLLHLYDITIGNGTALKFAKTEERINFVVNQINAKLMGYLTMEVKDGAELGRELMKNFLGGKSLTPTALLQYDYLVAHRAMGIEQDFSPINFSEDCDGLEFQDDGQLYINYYKLLKNPPNRYLSMMEKCRDHSRNLLLMTMLRYVAVHKKAGKCRENSKDQREVLMALDKKLEQAEDGYSEGKASHHIASHDNMPSVIYADIKALELVIKSIKNEYNNVSSIGINMEHFVEYFKMSRMNDLRRQYKFKDNNYRLAILKEALSSGRLTRAEREAVKQINDGYMKVYKPQSTKPHQSTKAQSTSQPE